MIRAIVWMICVYLALLLFGCQQKNNAMQFQQNQAELEAVPPLQSGPDIKISAGAYCAAARLLESQGSLKEAAARYRRAIEIDPAYGPAYNGYALLCMRLTEYPEAERTFKKALAMAPNDASLHNNLAYLYIVQKQYQNAEAELKNALAADPEFNLAKMNLAVVLGRLKRFAEARQYLEQVCRPYEAVYNLGVLHQFAGEVDQARKYYEQALLENPRFTPARVALDNLASAN
ncbi:MAG: tetratricopeptide repeat protein [Phycisphaerae bacterium]|nr:tetratricopeptide repeat protein [Phycisphaerae bacterium]